MNNHMKEVIEQETKPDSDKEKLLKLANDIENFVMPDMQEQQNKYRITGLKVYLKEVAGKLRKEVNETL